MTVQPDDWEIYLSKYLHELDVPLVAHIKYDRWSARIVRSIHSQLEIADPQKANFLGIMPWNKGATEIEGVGIDMPETNTFLMLDQRKTTLAGFNRTKFRMQRVNTLGVKNADPADEQQEPAPLSTVVIATSLDSEEVEIYGDDYPSHGAGTVKIREASHQLVLTSAVVRQDPETADNTERDTHYIDAPDGLSAGDVHGTGSGLGTADIVKPDDESEVVSHGTLLDLWNSLKQMQRSNPEFILSLETHDARKGFISLELPKLTLFPIDELRQMELESHINKTPKINKWLKVHPGNPRGLMIIRVEMKEKTFLLIEVEREIIKGDEKDNIYAGLVIELAEDVKFDSFLKFLFPQIARHCGVMKHVSRALVSTAGINLGVVGASAYKHYQRNIQDAGVIAENTIRNVVVNRLGLEFL